jgi:hypothetical protein
MADMADTTALGEPPVLSWKVMIAEGNPVRWRCIAAFENHVDATLWAESQESYTTIRVVHCLIVRDAYGNHLNADN